VAPGGQQVKEFDAITIDGTVVGVNRNSATVELINGAVIRGIIAGKLMRHRIKIVAGGRGSQRASSTPYRHGFYLER